MNKLQVCFVVQMHGSNKKKNNLGKLKNGVFSFYIAYFQDGRQIEEKTNNKLKSNMLRMSNWNKAIQPHFLMIGGLY